MFTSMTRTPPHDWLRLREQAEDEAARYALKAEYEDRVASAIAAARRCLRGDSVDGHAVRFNPRSWAPVLDALPVHCVETGVITRGDVTRVADREVEHAGWKLFVSSYVWGQGKNGYGLARLDKIERETPVAALDTLIAEALRAGTEHGPMAGYHRLRGEHRQPVAAKHWGAAFFTKALYFGLRDQGDARPALILDKVMASRVVELGHVPWMLYRGSGYNWSHYRYGVYLAWMAQTAEKFTVSPELLEYALFTMKRRPGTTAC